MAHPDPTRDITLALTAKFQAVRRQSEALVSTLSDADATAQSMEDASPAKWHLAHTSWFFETFLLLPFQKNYRCFNSAYDHLFNSYYQTVGSMHARPRRGLLSRPGVSQILDFRSHVDAAVLEAWRDRDIAAEIGQRWRFPVLLSNDVTAACSAALVFAI